MPDFFTGFTKILQKHLLKKKKHVILLIDLKKTQKLGRFFKSFFIVEEKSAFILAAYKIFSYTTRKVTYKKTRVSNAYVALILFLFEK